MNYYRRYIGDYARDTTALSLAEHGAYALLLDAYYADEHPLPAELPLLYRICRATDKVEQAAVRRIAEKFFPVGEDNLRHNTRADRELLEAKPAIEAARSNGRKGGRRSRRVSQWDTGLGNPVGSNGGYPDGGPDGQHPPSTTLQPPASDPPTGHPPDSAAAQRNGSDSAERTRPTRQAYSDAYEARWQVRPVLDKQANSMLKQFVEKLGIEEGPAVAAFYLTHNRQDYVRSKHDVSLLLRDARGLRTEWATGRQVTDTEARQADKTGAGLDQVNRLLAEAGRHR